MTDANSSIGSVYKVWDPGLGAYLTVGGIKNLSGPDLSAEQIDVSNLDSEDGYKENIGGTKDPGTLEIEFMWFGTDDQVYLRDNLAAAGSAHKIEFADGTIADFTGVITGFSIKGDPTDALTATTSIRLTGQVTWSTEPQVPQPTVFVRADGTATTLAAANDPSDASTSLSLAQLETLRTSSPAIPSGTVIGFSDQGGDFDTAPSANDSMIQMAEGVSYTTVLDESPVFDTRTPAISGKAFVTAWEINSALMYGNGTGQFQYTGGGGRAAIYGYNSTANPTGLIDVAGVVVNGNWATGGLTNDHDGVSTQQYAEISVHDCELHDILRFNDPNNSASTQVFAGHGDNSTLTAYDCEVHNFNMLTANADDSDVYLTNITSTDCWQEYMSLSDSGSGTAQITGSTHTSPGVHGSPGGGLANTSTNSTGSVIIDSSNLTFTDAKERFHRGGTMTFQNGTQIEFTSGALKTITFSNAPNDVYLNIHDTSIICNDTRQFIKSSDIGQNVFVDIKRSKIAGSGSICIDLQDMRAGDTLDIEASTIAWFDQANAIMFPDTAAVSTVKNSTLYSNTTLIRGYTGSGGVTYDNVSFVGVDSGSNAFQFHITGAPTWDFDYCHFYNVGSSYATVKANANSFTNEIGTNDEDPLFGAVPVAGELGDFSIGSGSPLAAAGKVIAGVSLDVEGASYHATTPAVGANEVT